MICLEDTITIIEGQHSPSSIALDILQSAKRQAASPRIALILVPAARIQNKTTVNTIIGDTKPQLATSYGSKHQHQLTEVYEFCIHSVFLLYIPPAEMAPCGALPPSELTAYLRWYKKSCSEDIVTISSLAYAQPSLSLSLSLATRSWMREVHGVIDGEVRSSVPSLPRAKTACLSLSNTAVAPPRCCKLCCCFWLQQLGFDCLPLSLSLSLRYFSPLASFQYRSGTFFDYCVTVHSFLAVVNWLSLCWLVFS